MRKEGWATLVAGASAVGFSVTPEFQSWWLAGPTWLVTAYAGWRWYSEGEEPTNSFEGRFFVRPAQLPIRTPPRLRLNGCPEWLDVDLETIAMGYGPPSEKGASETSVSIHVRIRNESPTEQASVRFFLTDTPELQQKGTSGFRAAASDAELKAKNIPPAPGMRDLPNPVIVPPMSEQEGGVWFFAPRRADLPFKGLLAEELGSRAMWMILIPTDLQEPKDGTFVWTKDSKVIAIGEQVPIQWLIIRYGGIGIKTNRPDGHAATSMYVELLNRHPDQEVHLVFFLTMEVDGEKVWAAPEFEARTLRGVRPGLAPAPLIDIFPPVTLLPRGEIRGHLWFFYRPEDRWFTKITARDAISQREWHVSLPPRPPIFEKTAP